MLFICDEKLVGVCLKINYQLFDLADSKESISAKLAFDITPYGQAYFGNIPDSLKWLRKIVDPYSVHIKYFCPLCFEPIFKHQYLTPSEGISELAEKYFHTPLAKYEEAKVKLLSQIHSYKPVVTYSNFEDRKLDLLNKLFIKHFNIPSTLLDTKEKISSLVDMLFTVLLKNRTTEELYIIKSFIVR